jgi:hypothetical protein
VLWVGLTLMRTIKRSSSIYSLGTSSRQRAQVWVLPWAAFRDGRLLVIIDNLVLGNVEVHVSESGASGLVAPPSHSPAALTSETALASRLRAAGSAAQETAMQLPSSDQARLLAALGTHYERHDVAPALGSLLSSAGYRLAPGRKRR